MGEVGFADLYDRIEKIENKIDELERKIQKYSVIDELFDGLFKKIDELYGDENVDQSKPPPPKPKPPTAILIKEGDLGPKKEK